MQGGSAVSAVQTAVNALEDNPVFDAGSKTFSYQLIERINKLSLML